jgi:NADPH:quinone reductase-like Zn-dependent oxidoreductase
MVKQGGKWYRIGNSLNQIASADEAVEICSAKGVECQAGDLRRYWVEPDNKNVGEMTRALEQADELYKSGAVKVLITETIPFAVAKAVEESGTGKHTAKVVVKF